MTLPSAAEIEHADWPTLKEHALALGLNPKGRSGMVRQRILDRLRTGGTEVVWRAGRAEQAALLTRLGSPDVAIRLWESTIRLDSPAPWVGLGTAYERAGRLGEAVKCFDRAIQMGDDAARLHKAHALAHGGATEAALAELDVAISARPNDVRAWAQRAAILESIGRSDEVIFAYARIGDLVGNRLGLARALMKAHRFDDAEIALAAHLADHPRDATAWSNRGVCLAKRERWKAALEALQQATALAERDPSILNNIACVLAAMGKTDEALRKLRAARRLHEDPRILLNEAALLERTTPVVPGKKPAPIVAQRPAHRAGRPRTRRVARKPKSRPRSTPPKRKARRRANASARRARRAHRPRRQ